MIECFVRQAPKNIQAHTFNILPTSIHSYAKHVEKYTVVSIALHRLLGDALKQKHHICRCATDIIPPDIIFVVVAQAVLAPSLLPSSSVCNSVVAIVSADGHESYESHEN